MNTVFVLGSALKPLMPCHPSRARQLLTAGRAAVYRVEPFTIILKDRAEGETQPIEFKVDPGSKTTGIALVGEFPQQGRVVLFGANLQHRGDAIRSSITGPAHPAGWRRRYKAASITSRPRDGVRTKWNGLTVTVSRVARLDGSSGFTVSRPATA